MNSKVKGILQFLVVAVLIAAFAFVAFVGIGKAKLGSAENIRLGLDLQGGVSVTYEAVKADPTEVEMQDTINKMQRRVEDISTEAAVYQEGSNRVTIDIPGVSNAKEILDKLGQAGALQFVLYENLTKEDGSANPEEGDVVKFDEKNLELDGSMIETADAATQQSSTVGTRENVVSLKFTGKGTKKFAEVTSDHVGEALAIVYDNKLVSYPTIQSEISDGQAVITGNFDAASAADMASTLRIGALPLELKNIHDNVVGATLGSEALQSSLLAGIIGLILVMLFMIVMYRLPGVSASIALVFYVGAMLVTLNVLDVTLTLPGVAGIILSIGMAVDANCIIFTRMREELATGKTVSTAIKNGFSKALSAIIDGNITTLIAALVLYLRGSGTVKGFAQTLAIGIILSMITAIFVTRLLLHAFCHLGCTNIKLYGVQKELKTIDFIGNWKKYVCISGAVVVVLIAGMIINFATKDGAILNYSLDFVGGTSTSVSVDENTEITDELKEEVLAVVKDTTGLQGEVSSSDDKGVKKVTVRTTALTEDQRHQVTEKLASRFGVDQGQIEAETISASVSSEMQKNAVVATIIATICMLIYIWIRFRKFATGASAVLALLHDVIVVFTVYVVASSFIQVGSTFIACMLTIVGYSINDTIVVFDRIRENKEKATSRTELSEIINKSITETLSRSINTSITTFIMVLVLAILGVSSVRQFAIPLMVGIISGCYSSVCVAAPLWYLLSGKGKKENKAVSYAKKSK